VALIQTAAPAQSASSCVCVYAYYLLALHCLDHALNFVDRQIVDILEIPQVGADKDMLKQTSGEASLRRALSLVADTSTFTGATLFFWITPSIRRDAKR